jgi:hypothetical protein
MQKTFSIAKYYNVKRVFHSMTCTLSSVIYCVPAANALQSAWTGKSEVALEAALAVDNGPKTGG